MTREYDPDMPPDHEAADIPESDYERDRLSEEDMRVTNESKPDDSFFDSFISDTSKLNDVVEAMQKGARCFSVLFDATGSMASHWANVRDGLITALDAIQGRTGRQILVQMIAYRDHCDGKLLFQRSGFHTDFQQLRDWISHIRCTGGGDYPEAVDVGLNAVLQSERQSHRCILVGDAPAHAYSPAHKEAIMLGAQPCSVFTVRTGSSVDEPSLVKNFDDIARLSGGKAFKATNAEEISDVVATIISRDQELLGAVIGALPYYPKSETAKQIASEL